MSAGFVDAGSEKHLTFSSKAPERRIDALVVKGATVRSHGIPDLPAELLGRASDHLPVVAVLDLEG